MKMELENQRGLLINYLEKLHYNRFKGKNKKNMKLMNNL